MENGYTASSSGANTESRKHAVPKQKPPSDNSSTGHKRSLSGSILSKLSFLQVSQPHEDAEDVPQFPSEAISFDSQPSLSTRSSGGSMAAAVQTKKARKRKGSLRKTALLGTRLRLEGKERRASNLEQVKTLQAGEQNHALLMDGSSFSSEPLQSPLSDDLPTPRNTHFPIRDPQPNLQTKTGDTSPSPPLSKALPPFNSLLHSPTLGSASTTDEDDAIPSLPNLPPTPNPKKYPFPTPTQNFPPPATLLRHRPHPKKSPLASHLPIDFPSPTPAEEEWSYSETRYWGWFLLAITWLVFVVGMGSCFEVWSWAWDVGETPYAPPELEDDPTLPIVGYYPALIILTGVMAWVWVVVAWVGMKYFKHAKISGEEG